MLPKKKILFVRTNAINPDPRIEKEIGFLLDLYHIEVLAWDRENEYDKFEKRNGYTIIRCHTGDNYGAGIRHLYKLVLWQFQELKYLLKLDFDIIHSCDFDTFLPALIVAKLRKKRIVYDVCDFYADTIVHGSYVLKSIIKKIDIFLMQFADGVILADDNRKKQIQGSKPKKLAIICNVPHDFYERFRRERENSKNDRIFLLTFVGMIQKERGFDVMADVIKEILEVKLIVGGYGPYEKEFTAMVEKSRNMEFLGKVLPYEKTIEIESKSDALFALYDPCILNHRYSSPNKLFEAMMLGKPIIVSKNTGMDEVVERYNVGIVVEYNNKQQLRCAILKLIDMKKKGDNSFGENGRKAYVAHFSPSVLKRNLIDFYSQIT